MATFELVLDYYPGIERSFVDGLYAATQSYEAVITHIALDLKGEYPKQQKVVVNFKSIKEPIPKAAQVMICKFFVAEFKNLNVSFLIQTLKQFNYHLFPTFKYLYIPYLKLSLTMHTDDEDDVYQIKENPLRNHIVPLENMKRPTSKNEEEVAFRVMPSLKDEFDFVQGRKKKYLKKYEEIKELHEERRRTIDFRKDLSSIHASSLTNSLTCDDDICMLECSICAQSYLVREIIPCRNETNPHKVCRYCLKEVLKQNLNEGLGLIGCQGHTTCTAGYRDTFIKSILNARQYARYDEICIMNDLRKLDNPNVYGCPFCFYAVESDAQIKELECKNIACGVVSCMLCKKNVTSHNGGECPTVLKERAEKDLAGDFSNYVAAEIDKVYIRKCQKCKKAIVKDQGCNHIRCTCGFNFCYLCRKPMEVQDNPSDHFKPTACPQYTSQMEDDRLLRERTVVRAKADWYAKHPNAQHIRLQI